MKEKTNDKYAVKIVTVTPEMARAMLDTSLRNRTVNQRRVDKYAHDMIIGNWSPATMLITDEDGHMVDAHHRLLAVIKSGKPIQMVKFTGLEKRFIPYIDTGRPRSAGDMLAFVDGLDGVTSLRNKAALVRVVLLAKAGGAAAKIVGYDDIATCMLDNRDNVNASYEEFKLIRSVGATVGVAAAIYLIHEANPSCGKVDRFINELTYGEMIQSGMPTFALRNALFNSRATGTQRQINDVYFVLRAWRAFVDGEEMKILRRPKVYNSKEDFQVAVAR